LSPIKWWRRFSHQRYELVPSGTWRQRQQMRPFAPRQEPRQRQGSAYLLSVAVCVRNPQMVASSDSPTTRCVNPGSSIEPCCVRQARRRQQFWISLSASLKAVSKGPNLEVNSGLEAHCVFKCISYIRLVRAPL